MYIVFLGAPGVGKGTQSKTLAEWLKYPQLSTGDILRQAYIDGTEVGLMAQKIIKNGELVPDEVMNQIVEERIAKPDCEKSFILDGFPRTLQQAYELNNLLQKRNKRVDKVMYLKADYNTLIERLSGRWISPTGKEYHSLHNPPEDHGICDDSGELLTQRPDDKKDKVAVRIKTFEKQTLPLVEYYKSLNVLVEIDTQGSIDTVFELIKPHFNKPN